MSSANPRPIPEQLPRPLPVWSAPLVPVALALTIGIVFDRFWIVPLLASSGAAIACLVAWFLFSNTSQHRLALVYLWASVAGLGAACHHWHRYHVDAADLSFFADHDGRPTRLRGTLQSAPITQAKKRDLLRSIPVQGTTRFMVRATHRQDLATRAWHDVTGLVQVTIVGPFDDITVGDEVELLGRLALPEVAVNPGGFDHAAFLRDQGITTTLAVLDTDEATLVRHGWPTSPLGVLAVVRGWGQRTLARDFAVQENVASALLLGEGSDMSGEDWERYQRTGVIHALAISGQHLAVLAGFLWLVSPVIGLRRRTAAPWIALFLIAYALLTGGRPPVMRAAWMVGVYCGGILLQRPVAPANTLALAWTGVVLTKPTDIFNAGCQLSFLAVAILVLGVGGWAARQPADPLERADMAAPRYLVAGRWVLRWLLLFYVINAVVWLAVAPLVAAQFHLFSPVALLIGPPVVVLTSVALLTGFAFLLFAGWCWPLAWLFGWLTQGSLLGCDWLVTLGLKLPGGYFFVADVPAWWLWLFYVPLLVSLTLPIPWRLSRWLLVAGGVWLALGAAQQLLPHRPGEFRCTFVAVGHGGCTVLETANGRVIIYDAGATGGPDVTRRHIAPFLWSRGIRHIDDLVLSHADLDHFNGVPQLAERFTIGRVLSTPTFAERSLPAVQQTVGVLEKLGIELKTVHAGQTWEVDDVAFAVLHPPPAGPAGKENVRSLVLHVTHRDFSLLLTGDLEEAGLKQVLDRPAPRLDVLMAPHHGSDTSNIPDLAKWARPKLVVSSQTAPLSERLSVKMYQKMGATFLGTWPHGAITIRPDHPEATVETYRSRLRLKY